MKRVLRCLCCCRCPRRRGVWARESLPFVSLTAADSALSLPLATCRSAEGLRDAAKEEDSDDEFHECRSMASEHDVHDGALLANVPPPPRGSSISQTGERLLATLFSVEQRCSGMAVLEPVLDSILPGDLDVSNLEVDCVLEEGTTRFFLCNTPGCPMVTACLTTRLSNVSVADALLSIRCPRERLVWDRESFRSFEVLSTSDAESAQKSCADIIRCVMPAPRPARDRELLQHRWMLPLQDGGQALIMRSFHDSSISPPRNEYVRAFTYLSGYILRPIGQAGELEIVAISRIDLGGAIPTWMQNLIRRLAKRRPVEWVRRLGQHCEQLRKAREYPAPQQAVRMART